MCIRDRTITPPGHTTNPTNPVTISLKRRKLASVRRSAHASTTWHWSDTTVTSATRQPVGSANLYIGCKLPVLVARQHYSTGLTVVYSLHILQTVQGDRYTHAVIS